MPTPDDIYSGINQRMQEAMQKLREGGGAVADGAKSRLGGSFDPLKRGLAGMNPVTSIGSVMQQASPHIKKAADAVGGAINQPGVREWTNDKAINAIAGTNPVTGALMLGAQGSRLVNAQSKKTTNQSQAPGTPDTRSGTVSKPSAYPTNAELKTIKPSTDYQKEANNPPRPVPGAVPGDTIRTNLNGVVQKGTSTSPKPMTMDDANKLLSSGYKIENPYSSNQLPTTASSPYAGKSNAQIYNPDTLHQHDSDVDYVSLSKNLDEDKSGVATYQRGKNMNADYKQMDVNPGQKVPEKKINWANRTMADNSDEKVRRRSAMLDDYNGADGNPVGIMERMRNQEAIQGRKYAGGKHYQANKNAGQEGQDDFVEISAGQARARSNYTKTADEVFANHLGKAKEKTSGADLQTVSQNAPAMLPGAIPGQTPMDKSPFDTEELMQQQPSKSIIGNNTPYTSVNRGTLLR